MEILVRRATPADAGQIAKVNIETYQSTYRGQVPQDYLDAFSIPERAEKWKEILDHPEKNAITLVAEVDGKVVGFASVEKSRNDDTEPDTGELWAIYVDKNHQDQGVGSALHDKGLNILREKGFKKAILWVLTTNEKAIKWYESKGWKIEGKTNADTRHGVELHESRYIKDL